MGFDTRTEECSIKREKDGSVSQKRTNVEETVERPLGQGTNHGVSNRGHDRPLSTDANSPAVLRRCRSDVPSKGVGEVTLIGESGGEGDLDERGVGIYKLLASVFDP